MFFQQPADDAGECGGDVGRGRTERLDGIVEYRGECRLEARSVVYIETIESTVLEMKQNFILQGGMSFFFPRMK